MPVKSAAQLKLMEGVAHGSIQRKGLSKAVATDFVQATPKPDRSALMKGVRRKPLS